MNVTAIIPAYNEESTVEQVIEAVKACDKVDEIIVVSDGSTDSTAGIARSCGVKVLELPENVGKGGAMKAGLAECDTDIVLFLDADLLGLTREHIEKLIEPVEKDEADMCIGIFSGGRFSTDLAQKISPYLSGQRALKKEIIDRLSEEDVTGYGVEAALTLYAQRENIRLLEVELVDLTHVMKEEKLGLVRGVGARMKMYWQILKGLRLIKNS